MQPVFQLFLVQINCFMYLFLLCIIYFFDSYEEPIMPSLFLLAKEKFEFILQYLKYLRFFRLQFFRIVLPLIDHLLIDFSCLTLDASYQNSFRTFPALLSFHQLLKLTQFKEASCQKKVCEFNQYSLFLKLRYSQKYSDDLVINEVYLQAVQVETQDLLVCLVALLLHVLPQRRPTHRLQLFNIKSLPQSLIRLLQLFLNVPQLKFETTLRLVKIILQRIPASIDIELVRLFCRRDILDFLSHAILLGYDQNSRDMSIVKSFLWHILHFLLILRNLYDIEDEMVLKLTPAHPFSRFSGETPSQKLPHILEKIKIRLFLLKYCRDCWRDQVIFGVVDQCLRNPSKEYLVKQYPYTPHFSFLIIAFLHYYLRNMEITHPFLFLLDLIGIPRARNFVNPILYHNIL